MPLMPAHTRPSLALLTDLYQLTMACAYWKSGTEDVESVFHLTFRSNPFGGGFAVACGLEQVLDFVRDFHFDSDDLAYLASLPGADGSPLFDSAFLERLRSLRLTCDIDAIPEGTPVFANEPLLRVRGPILQCQLLETPLLNLVGFPTLVATRAARVCHAARGVPVVEFGLRRAQGPDGALTASRAAYLGGCVSTSNVLAGRVYGIPVAGTHAHSWVMLFPHEREAFQAYAEALPNNCVFLVDTYDSLQGVRNAIEVGRWLRERGHRMLGIRLDSGDLAWLSSRARELLDEAGFQDATIVASNDLDENLIASLNQQGAPIGLWGVGTHLVTAYDQPALGAVYKLSAIRRPGGSWEHRIKLSEQAAKISTPGILQVRRFADRAGACVADMIFDELTPCAPPFTLVDPLDPTRRRKMGPETRWEDLLVPVIRSGEQVYRSPPLPEMRQHVQRELARFDPTTKRFLNPHQYPVGLEAGLYGLKAGLVVSLRAAVHGAPAAPMPLPIL